MANPILSEKTFRSAYASSNSQTMTINGTLTKTLLLVLMVAVAAAYSWKVFYTSVDPMGSTFTTLMLGGVIVAFILAMIIAFKPNLAQYLSPVYAVGEGLAIGGISAMVNLQFAEKAPNIVINAVIAEGEEYQGDGFVGLTQPGSYKLPLKSKVGDCDSIVTLNLVVGEATDYAEVNICFGETYQFGTQTIATSGEYIEKFTEDSVVLLKATVLPDLRQTIDAYICKGESYNEYGFEGLTTTGVYTQELLSVDGCDSTITLNLTVLNGETRYVRDTITTEELPYEYMGLYYDIATAPGVHENTITLEADNCKDIIVHTLVVQLADAVENVEALDLVLVPNPVKANNTLYVEAEFTVNERKDMLVEVFNAVGQRVIVDTPTVYPVEINGMSERGVYIVRIVTGDGNVYQGKVVVQ